MTQQVTIGQHEIAKAEQQRIAAMLNVMHGAVSVSVAPWGVSLYATIQGRKVRFSDHTTSGFSGRHLNEIHLPLGAGMDLVQDELDRRNPANYRTEVVEYVYECPAEKDVICNWGKIVSITKGEFVKVSKKGNEVFKFYVTAEKRVYNK